MEKCSAGNWVPFDNILYIGDEPKVCLSLIERFNSSLLEIEQNNRWWFTQPSTANNFRSDKLQRHIHYHFEGGIVVFKFRNQDDLPQTIKNECFTACKNLAAEQLLFAS